MPGEKRTWKVFNLDIWKQLLTAGFSHGLNMFLSFYLQDITKSGNGCVWYVMNVTLDNIFGTLIAYSLFRILDNFAVKNKIEVLK